MVDMVVEIQTERRKVTEAMNARDAVVQRLVDAYESIHEKTALIEHLQKQIQQEPRGDSPFPFKTGPGGEKSEASRAKDGISGLENAIKRLREERELLKERRLGLMKSPDPPPSYDEGALKVRFYTFERRLLSHLCRSSILFGKIIPNLRLSLLIYQGPRSPHPGYLKAHRRALFLLSELKDLLMPEYSSSHLSKVYSNSRTRETCRFPYPTSPSTWSK